MKLFLAFVIVILLSACLGKPTNTLEECESKESIEQRDSCYATFALDRNDLSFCTQIIDAETRNNCINSIS